MDESNKGNLMKRLFFVSLYILIFTSIVSAATTSTNGYFYLPAVGDSGSGIHDTWVATQEATDAVIKANADKVTNATHTGDVTGSGALTIGNDKILESMLKAVDAAADEECLTYETTTGDFEWQECGSGSGDVTGVGDCASGACLDGTSDGGTTISLYDGDSHKGTIDVPDIAGDVTYTLPSATSTLLATDGVGTALTALNGENIQDDTIDDDSIDFADVTGVDITLTDAGAVTSSAAITATTSFIIGAADINETDLEKIDGITNGTAAANKAVVLDASLDIATINSLTATTLVGALTGNASTATALAANGGNCAAGSYPLGVDASGAIEDCTDATTEINTEIGNVLDGTDAFTDFNGADIIDSDNYNTDSVDNEHINWADIDNLGDEGVIPSGAAVTDPNAAGELAIDTTTDQFLYYGGAQRVLTYRYTDCKTLETPVDADDNIPVWAFPEARTITDVHCYTEGGTSIAVTISDGSDALEAVTCDADGADDDGSITNGTFTANENIEWDFAAPTGTVDWVKVCITTTITAD